MYYTVYVVHQTMEGIYTSFVYFITHISIIYILFLFYIHNNHIISGKYITDVCMYFPMYLPAFLTNMKHSTSKSENKFPTVA